MGLLNSEAGLDFLSGRVTVSLNSTCSVRTSTVGAFAGICKCSEGKYSLISVGVSRNLPLVRSYVNRFAARRKSDIIMNGRKVCVIRSQSGPSASTFIFFRCIASFAVRVVAMALCLPHHTPSAETRAKCLSILYFNRFFIFFIL